MKVTRIELYCRDESTSAVLRALATVKGVLAEPGPRVIPTDMGNENDETPSTPLNAKHKAKKKGRPPAKNTTSYGTINDAVLDALTNRIMNVAEIAEATGYTTAQVGNAVDRLKVRKRIRKMAHNRYKVKPGAI